ncbi:alpha/beta fold hydrolase [Ilumatobacter sp.]|uniref:alpha/beta fold hydrolase n=1 Tax=Ilumatobacter sp. TaxID=1967498 RepID=UPI003AF9E240
MASEHVRGTDLVYDRQGTGPDVVWGHGLTSSMASEDELGLFDFPAIGRTATVLRYDARGHGESGSTVDSADYHWRALAEDQLALADRLGIGAYVAGGASMGAATALHAAVLAPDRIRGLVLVIPPTAWATRAAQTGVYTTMADLVAAGDHETLLAGAAARPSPDPFTDDPYWGERFERVLTGTDPERLARVFRGAATTDLPAEEQVATIAVPTLILAWTGDPGHPASSAARLQELIAGSELALAATPDGLAGWTSRVIEFLGQVS